MMASLSSVCLTMQNTALYKRFTEEREEILRNKWYMSERQGSDVGFERALMDWVSNHRNNWIRSKKK
jgi:hypothetical protein